MRSHILRSLLLVGLCIPTAGAAGPAPAPLDPLQNWIVDYGETQCAAVREFGDRSRPTLFGIVPSPDGTTYELLVKRPRSGPDFATEMPGTVDFGRGPIKAWLLYHAAKVSHFSFYRYRISAEQMAQARSAGAVTLHAEGGEDFSFKLAAMPALLDGLAKCTVDLRQYWNMDGEKDGRIAHGARGDVRKVFSADDYPSDAFQAGQEGRAQYLLLIDQKGSVAACHVLVPSGVPVLDAMGCQVIRTRAKFTPAVDRSGNPIRSTVTTPPVTWALG